MMRTNQVAAALAAASVLGCMRRVRPLLLAAVFAALLGAFGCASPAERLAGRWHAGDPEEGAEHEFVFRADGTYEQILTTFAAANRITGRWRLVSADGDVLVVELSAEGQPPQNVNLRFDGSDRLVSSWSGLTFHRRPDP